MRNRSWLVAALISLVLLPQAASAEGTRLTDAELVPLLSNMNLRITMPTTGKARVHHMQPVTAPGEKARLYSGKVIDRGWWWVENAEFCFEYWWVKGLLQICFAVEREGQELRFIATREIRPGPREVQVNRWAPSAQLWHDPLLDWIR